MLESSGSEEERSYITTENSSEEEIKFLQRVRT